MSDLFDDRSRRGNAARRARSGPRRSRALVITAVVLVVGVPGLHRVRVALDRAAVVRRGRLLRGLQHAALDPDRAVRRLRRADGGRRRRQHATSPTGSGRSSGRPRPEQNSLDRYREAVTPIRTWLLVGISRAARRSSPAARRVGQWRSLPAVAQRRAASAQTDPYFNNDIGFYVFDLPWLHYLVDFAMAVARRRAARRRASCTTCTAASGCSPPRDRLSGAAQVQLSVLLGVFVLAKAADYWLDRFDLVNQGPAR